MNMKPNVSEIPLMTMVSAYKFMWIPFSPHEGKTMAWHDWK